MNIVEVAKRKGYTVNKEGNVIGVKGYKLRSSKDSNGYLRLGIRDFNGKIQQLYVHRFVAYIKYGDSLFNTNIQVRHLNGDPCDNSWDNIAIGTPKENAMDKLPETRLRSAMIATSYVRKYDRLRVKEYYSKCKSYKKTMEHFGIGSKGTLHFILNKKSTF